MKFSGLLTDPKQSGSVRKQSGSFASFAIWAAVPEASGSYPEDNPEANQKMRLFGGGGFRPELMYPGVKLAFNFP